MSVMSLNCWGVGNASTGKELRDLVKKFAPGILCIQETQISRDRVESLVASLGFDQYFEVDSTTRSGGLGIYWNNEINIGILGYSQYHIDVSVVGISENPLRNQCLR
jgi:exonuclease III